MNKLNSHYPLKIKITGVGRYLPKRRVLSSELEEECGLEKGWCERRQGVRERRWVEDETASFMAAEAAKEAAKDANIDISDIDLIINASGTPEHVFPDGAPLIQRELGLEESGISCMSMHTTCMSFITALDTASCMLAVGRYRNILVVSSEVMSSFISSKKPDTYTLLGDAAAAAIVTATPPGEKSCFHSAFQKTYSVGVDHCRIPYGSTINPVRNNNIQLHDYLFHMDGKKILQTGGTYSPKLLNDFLDSCELAMDDIKVIITHQASKIALDRISLSLPKDKLVRIVDRFGNCAAASVPLALYEALKTGRMERGDTVLITGPAGAGMTMCGIALTY